MTTSSRLVTLLLLLTLLACGKEPESAPAAPPEQAAPAAVEKVQVAAEGSTFDPPVALERIPDGSWACVMETVHYARPDQGDGKCPTCGMALTQVGAKP